MLKAADLSCDMELLRTARDAAQELLVRDPGLREAAHAPLRRRIAALFEMKESTLNWNKETEARRGFPVSLFNRG